MENLTECAQAPIWREVPTPSYVIDEGALQRNLRILRQVRQDTGAKILLAQKCFSLYQFYPLIGEYLDGAAASGLFEARLAAEEMGRENHVFSPAYKEAEFAELRKICDHAVFNSFAQWQKFKAAAMAEGISCGMRVNPEFSTQDKAIYDPCAKGSRLGVKLRDWPKEEAAWQGLEGLHFHTLCEQGAEDLAATLEAVEEKFGFLLSRMKWLNFGGGHHITKEGYNLPLLYKCIAAMQDKYALTVYLEPGEAVALNAGFLVSEVLEVQGVEEGVANVILDTSAACHMPDVLEMPYRPPVLGAALPHAEKYTYRFGGPTCLAGDVIGLYSFAEPLAVGDRVIFGDMAIYTMVKNNTFNGMPLPTIIALHANRTWEVLRQFGYEDFKWRL